MIVLENANDKGRNYFGKIYELTDYNKVVGGEEEDKGHLFVEK